MPQDSLGIHLLLLLFFFGPIKPCNLLLHSRLCHLYHVLLGIKAAELAICPSGALCWNVVQWWLPRKYLGKKYLKALLNMTRLVAIIEPVCYKLISPFLLWKFWNVGSYARRHSKIAQLNVPSTHVACRFVMFWWNSHGYHARQRKLRWFQQFSTFFRNWTFYSSVSRFGASAEIPAVMPLNELCMKLPNTYRHIAIDCWKRGFWRAGIEESSWIWLIHQNHQMIHSSSWSVFAFLDSVLPKHPASPSSFVISFASWLPPRPRMRCVAWPNLEALSRKPLHDFALPRHKNWQWLAW